MDLFALATLPTRADEAEGTATTNFYALRDNLGEAILRLGVWFAWLASADEPAHVAVLAYPHAALVAVESSCDQCRPVGALAPCDRRHSGGTQMTREEVRVPRESVVVEAYRHLVDDELDLPGELAAAVIERRVLTCELRVDNILDLRSQKARTTVDIADNDLF